MQYFDSIKQIEGPFNKPGQYREQQILLGWLSYYQKLTTAAAGRYAFLHTDIQYLPHQFKTAEKIATNSHTRWLIADDIGIGKTITSCHLAKLIETTSKTFKLRIIAPKHLHEHWSEHVKRFKVTSKPEIVTFEETGVITDSADLTILDEAHLYFDLHRGYWDLLELCNSKRVVYLTATPSSIRSNVFSDLLSIVDPCVYPRSTAINQLNYIATRRRRLPTIRALNLSTTDTVQEFKSMGLSEADLNKPLSELVKVSDYVIEHYRASIAFQNISPYHRILAPEQIRYKTTNLRDNLVQKFIVNVVSGSTDNKLSEYDYQQILLALNGISQPARLFLRNIKQKLKHEEQPNRLEKDELNQDDENKKKSLLEFLKRQFRSKPMTSFVIFVGLDEDADTLRDYLSEHNIDAGVPFIDEHWRSKNVLICSEHLETGLSLQQFESMIFYDIPVDINRIDQRIGRLDRFGRGTPFESHDKSLAYVYFCVPSTHDNDNNFLSHWLGYLRNGFGPMRNGMIIRSESGSKSQFNILDHSLNFCAYENDILVESFIKTKTSVPSLSWMDVSHHTLTKNGVERWTSIANFMLSQIRTSDNAVTANALVRIKDQDLRHRFEKDKQHLKEVLVWIAEWNLDMPFPEFKIKLTSDSNLAEISSELKRVEGICDFGYPSLNSSNVM
jgi:hypothetical protein